MSDGVITIEIRTDDKNAQEKLRDLKKSVGMLGGKSETSGFKISSMFKAFGAYKIAQAGLNVLKKSMDGAIKRYDTLSNADRVFENMGFGAKETKEATDSLIDSITGLPTSLDEAVVGVQRLASSTKDIKASEKIYSSLNNAVLGFGGSNEDVNRTVEQFSRSLQKGKIQGDEFNTMMDTMGPVMNAVAEEMGVSISELQKGLSDGSIDIDDFTDTLLRMNEEGGGGLVSLEKIARDSTGGIQTSIINAKGAVVRGVTAFIEKTNEALEKNGLPTISEMIQDVGKMAEKALGKASDYVEPFIDAIAEGTEAVKIFYDDIKLLKDDLTGFFKEVNPLIAGFAGFAGVLALVSGAIAVANGLIALGGTIASVASLGYTALGVAFYSINWPLVLIAAAIGIAIAAGVALYQNWDVIKEKAAIFKEKIIEIWEGIVEWFGELPEKINQKLEEVILHVYEWVDGMYTGAVEAGTQFINGVVLFFQTLPARVQTFLSRTIGRVIEWATDLWNRGKQAGNDLVTGVTSSVSSLPDKMFQAGKDLLNGFWDGFKSIKDSIHTRVTEFFDGIVTGVKKKLDINSPSRVFKKIGVETIEGYNVGWDKESKRTPKKVQGLFDEVLEVANQFYSRSLGDKSYQPIIDGGNYFPQLPVSAENGTSKTINNRYDQGKNLQVQVHVDGSHVKDERELSRELKLELQRLAYGM